MRNIDDDFGLFSNPLKRNNTFVSFDPLLATTSNQLTNKPSTSKFKFSAPKSFSENKENIYEDEDDEDYADDDSDQVMESFSTKPFLLKITQPLATANKQNVFNDLKSVGFMTSKPFNNKKDIYLDDKYEDIQEINKFSTQIFRPKIVAPPQIMTQNTLTRNLNAPAGLKSVSELRKYQNGSLYFNFHFSLYNSFISLYLAAEFRSIFSEFPFFNRVQSAVYDDVKIFYIPLFLIYNLNLKFLLLR
jgi:hypothetical protein